MKNIYIPSYLTLDQLKTIIAALPGSRNKDYMKSADNIIKNNFYTLPPFGVVKYKSLIDWNDNRSRSYERLIHGHTFLGCLVDAYLETNNQFYLDKGLTLISDWISKHNYEHQKDTMAFHDETTAMRLQYFLKFYILARTNIPKDEQKLLEKVIWEHAALLSDNDFHSTNTNHGMFQDIALLQFATYFKGEQLKTCTNYIDLAVKRLKEYFTNIFTVDGVHKEHSPSYHMLVATNLRRLISWIEEIDSTISSEFNSIYKKAEDFAIYIIRPDGFLPPICDTEPKPVRSSSYKSLYSSKEFLYSVNAGEKGLAPIENDKVFQEAGYAIFRDDWKKKKESSYVLFAAAYNADYHKHSDDLNVYIYRNGEIITEAGPNGYNYKDPFTKYAYSSFAHNTLVVDGKGLPRTDGKYDKVFMSDYKVSESESEATGVNLRFTGIEHKRNVKYNKKDQVVTVNDVILSEKKHEYKLLWHVASDIQVHVRDRFIELFRSNNKVMEIEFSTHAPINVKTVNGQENPNLLGWSFPKMEDKRPLTTIEVDLSGSDVDCTTYFRMESFKLGDGSSNPFQLEKTYVTNRSLRYHFEPAKDDRFKDRLFVVFSALTPTNKFIYNYMRSLEEIQANKLFILDDFGDQGSYYIGNKRDFSIETAVASLIQYIMSKHDILHKNVTTVGSSKGGYAALLFGIKYHFGNIIAGAPQSKIGHFLINQAGHPNIATYISGGADEADCYYLDQIIYQILNQPSDLSPKINILVGNKDHHYVNHVIPFCDALREKGYKVDLEVEQGTTHDDLRTTFPPYMVHKVKTIVGLKSEYTNAQKKLKINNITLNMVGENSVELQCKAEGTGLLYAYYVFKDKEIIEKVSYKKNASFKYSTKETGDYFIRVYVKDSNDEKVAMNTKSFVIKK
ncbi:MULTISPECIES: heparinase II/III domain-containing protein [Metabacillus]|uniref:Uncharacterized protein n=2 Tax=Metabacillus TaxID=2675233 RepID=A0A179T6Z4_9BACI|nr:MULTISPECIES: heparinase II/III family protein [Metabacillus]OAS88213.1 hypothetical protein A6K24_17725 [Metabacillus litoralis]QNF27355.1 heparinase II/III family protein [Metabacillus sp. KUDC1714]